MQGKTSINTFSDGMSEDSDILHSKATTYRYSMNGRMTFNKNGSYSWETENGSKVSFIIDGRGGTDNADYIPIGNTGNDNIRIVWSVRADQLASEIGIFSVAEDGIGSYKTLFNDQDDINSDMLNLLLKNQIEARFVYENDGLIRCYWVDGVAIDSNKPRVITIDYDPNIGNASDVAAYTASPNTSVHSMDSQAGFRMGMIKYIKNVGGNLTTGVYQYTYRLRNKDGYNTPWYPVTRRVFVCNSAVSATNWNEYEMNSSGLTSSVGNQIQVKGIDERYDEIHVGYISTGNGNVVAESKIFIQTKITSDIMTFDHASNVGEPIIPSEIADLFSGIVGAKTLNIKDSTLYYGNVKENLLPDFDIEPILAGLTMSPKFRDMRSDEWVNSTFASLNPPITHGWPRTGSTVMKQHAAVGGDETYVINNDYLNYKGTQVDHLYAGYFRGETYRMGIVFYDKLGFESFAFHLGDFKFPNQSENDYSWNRIKEDESVVTGVGSLVENAWPTNNYNLVALRSEKLFVGDTGQNLAPMDSINPSLTNDSNRCVSHLRIMGLEVGGIDVSSISSLISGFKIVRVKRDATILNQGLILPTIKVVDDADGDIIMPLSSTHQNFYDFVGGTIPLPTSVGDSIRLNEPHGFGRDGADPNDRFKLAANASVLSAPSVDFGSAPFPSIQSQDELVLVGGCWDEYVNDTEFGPYKATWAEQWYNKAYYSKNTFHVSGSGSLDPFPRYMSKATMSNPTILNPQGVSAEWKTGFDLVNICRTRNSTTGTVREAAGKFNSIFLQHTQFSLAGSGSTNAFAPLYKNDAATRSLNHRGQPNGLSNFCGAFIYNYVRPNPNPYGGLTLSSLETSIFIGTGHFQPIGNPTFDTQGMPGGLIFNDIEVFGGDCYLDYHAQQRMYPWYQASGGSDDDYSDARIFPLEYEFNHSMRYGGLASGSGASIMYPNVGPRSGEDPPQWANGIHFQGYDETGFLGIREDFDLNATMGFEEILIFYSPKPVNFVPNDRFPVRWRYTREKIYGDTIDTWRLFQVNDFYDLNGQHGEITGSLYVFNQIYSWQISAFGRLRASDRALIESSNAGSLSTGIGDKLDGIDYTSTEFGLQHQWGLFSSDTAAYWPDVNKRKLMKFAQDGKQPLSDIKGIHQFLEEEMPLFEDHDNPVQNQGIHGTFDYGNNEAIFTFNRDRDVVGDPSGFTNIVSRHPEGKTFSKYVIRNNETVIVKDVVNGNVMNIPSGVTNIGINDNMIMYVKVLGSATTIEFRSIIKINETTNSVDIFLNAIPGNFYRLYRNGITEHWKAELVEDDDATPYRNSLSYNEYEDYFQGYHAYSPSHYMSTKFLVLSHDNVSGFSDKKNVRVHDMGLKADFPSFSKKSVLSVSMNEGPMASKVMDSLRINCNNDFNERFSMLLMETETQFYFIDAITDTRKKYLEDIYRIPLRSRDQPNRMRGKHILITLELKNNSVFNDRITNLVTYYRPSNRL